MKLLKKKTSILQTAVSVICISTLTPFSVAASDAVGPGYSDSKWILGIAAGAYKNPYISEDEETWISPTVRYNGERFFVKDDSFNIHVSWTYN